MDFIERWFGISPDGGNGMFEMMCGAAVLAGIFALASQRRVRRLGRHWIARARR